MGTGNRIKKIEVRPKMKCTECKKKGTHKLYIWVFCKKHYEAHKQKYDEYKKWDDDESRSRYRKH